MALTDIEFKVHKNSLILNIILISLFRHGIGLFYDEMTKYDEIIGD